MDFIEYCEVIAARAKLPPGRPRKGKGGNFIQEDMARLIRISLRTYSEYASGKVMIPLLEKRLESLSEMTPKRMNKELRDLNISI